MEIRRSYDRLISTMGFPISVRRLLYIESGPRSRSIRYRSDAKVSCQCLIDVFAISGRDALMMTSPKWKHFPRYWPFVRGIHRSPVNSPHKGQWRGTLMLSLICAWINGWVNNREAGDLKRQLIYYDVTVMLRTTLKKNRKCRWLKHYEIIHA